MPARYPVFYYAHQQTPNPLHPDLLQAVSCQQQRLQELREGRFTRSQDVEKALLPALQALGFQHSVTTREVAQLFHAESDFEIDFFHCEKSIALEVEKGKHFNVWRDLCKFAESPLVEHAVLVIPSAKTSTAGEVENTYLATLDGLANVRRLYRDLRSLLVIGY